MFDTHCHLNFKRFNKNLDEIISRAVDTGVSDIVVPGTDISSSKKAVEIARKHEWIYAAVGIHPHHAYELVKSEKLKIKSDIDEIETLLQSQKVVAVGEVGMDRHVYKDTKYEAYSIDKRFIEIQRDLLRLQIRLAIKYNKSLILHNREAKDDLLPILKANWDECLVNCTVFHCCEADLQLLDFAQEYKIFIGVDGDVTYDKKKQDFIRQVPIEMLVVETDSPFILPEPLLSQKKYPNEPANVRYVIEAVAGIKNVKFDKAKQQTKKNGKKLFKLI